MGKKEDIKQFTKELENLKYDKMYEGDFFLTWEKSRDELDAGYRAYLERSAAGEKDFLTVATPGAGTPLGIS